MGGDVSRVTPLMVTPMGGPICSVTPRGTRGNFSETPCFVGGSGRGAVGAARPGSGAGGLGSGLVAIVARRGASGGAGEVA